MGMSISTINVNKINDSEQKQTRNNDCNLYAHMMLCVEGVLQLLC